ncbi:SBBP repeat-containing protein, partial [Limnospira platensis]|uniref:SBBP repeat-containing protein n=1 Tax=Limnospira platensis TaxID=118562 RepID=UPI0015628C85
MNNTSEIFHIFESSDSQNFMPPLGLSGVEGDPVAVQMSAPPEFGWTRLLGTSEEDSATALTTGSDGSIYVAGYTYGDLDGQTNSGSEDAFISRFQPDGTKDWTRLLGTRLWDSAHALTTGSDGSIYVAGRTFDNLDGQMHSGGFYFVPDAFISRFQPDGTTDWTRLLGTRSRDWANALTTGSDGSIYVAGKTGDNLDGQTPSGRGDAFISRFQPDGTKDWTRLLGTSAWDEASALTTGSDGSIYVAGWTGGDLDGQTNSGGEWDAFISRFQPDGTQDWTRLLGTRLNDHARAMTTGSDGSIYVAGSTSGDLDGQTNNGGLDAFISRLIVDGADTPGRPEIHQVINWDSFPPQITGVLPGENQGSITQPVPNQWFGSDQNDVIIGTASDE